MVKLTKKKKILIIGGASLGVILLGILLYKLLVFKPKFELVSTGKTYTHSEIASTQGLFFDDEGELYETIGGYGDSAIYKNINLETGRPHDKVTFGSDIFGEGSTILRGKLYMLTYKENKAFVYDPEDLKLEREIDYPRSGWGLTTDGENLIASDGTAYLYYLDENLETLAKMKVIDENGEPVRYLNELEYIEGYVFANVWETDKIVMIDLYSGKVVKTFDFSNLYPAEERTKKSGVMNGIAYNKKTRKVLLTGKNWPNIYEFELR